MLTIVTICGGIIPISMLMAWRILGRTVRTVKENKTVRHPTLAIRPAGQTHTGTVIRQGCTAFTPRRKIQRIYFIGSGEAHAQCSGADLMSKQTPKGKKYWNNQESTKCRVHVQKSSPR